MKNQQTKKLGAVRAAPAGLAGLASRILAGVVTLLLISTAFSPRALAITFGEPDQGRHPNVGTVVVYHPVYGIIGFGTGTLVHPRVFLTAGHVTQAILSGEVVLLGVTFDEALTAASPLNSSTGFGLEVVDGATSYFWPSPSGAGAAPQWPDVGVLILAQPVTAIKPATLPVAGFLDTLKQTGQLQGGVKQTSFTVVGYGWDLTWPPPKPAWNYPATEVVYDGEPVLFWETERNLAQSGYRALNDGWLFLCQNQALDYGGTLNGDSGGPTFWNDAQGNEILVSITSWGAGWSSSVSYRIDTVTSLSFIQNAIAGLKAN